MPYLVSHLRRFNRKERFYLIGSALGNEAFRLGDEFNQRLSELLDLVIPEDAFVAMDYHLDWLFASMHLAVTSGTVRPRLRDPRLITGTQEDIDLLVAFDTDKQQSHVILLEAKGVTSYSNRQFKSKVDRLAVAFMRPETEGVIPHLVLVSPVRPQKLEHDGPSWMFGRDGRVSWLQLKLPPGMQKVVRCTEDGVPKVQSEYWKVVAEREF